MLKDKIFDKMHKSSVVRRLATMGVVIALIWVTVYAISSFETASMEKPLVEKSEIVVGNNHVKEEKKDGIVITWQQVRQQKLLEHHQKEITDAINRKKVLYEAEAKVSRADEILKQNELDQALKSQPPKNPYRYKALNWLVYNPESIKPQKKIEPRDVVPSFKKADIEKKYTAKLELGDSVKHDKWIVLTTIQGPTEDVKFMAKLEGWKVIVVADTKTPKDWRWDNCHFLSVEFQEKMGLQLPKILAYKSYARKNVGYMYAIAHGATVIYETDDDNRPTDKLASFDLGQTIPGMMFGGARLFNAYQYYGQSTLWQRGYPLGKVGARIDNAFRVSPHWPTPAVQQGVVNGDPDMDAVFRLTRKFLDAPLEVTFDPAGPPVIIPPGVFSPYNTQNTLIHQSAFWSMFLSSTLNFRITDIWRNYVGQRLLWEIGQYLAFYPPNAYQQRNSHDMMTDFADESEMYFTTEDLLEFLVDWRCPENLSFFQCFYKLMIDLADKSTVIFVESDAVAVRKWLEDLVMLGYEEPKRVNFQTLQMEKGKGLEKIKSDYLNKGRLIYFAPAEQEEPTIAWQTKKPANPAWTYAETVSSVCPKMTSSLSVEFISTREKVYQTFRDVLLIIYYPSPNYANIKNLEIYYRDLFPNIAYCGKDYNSFQKFTKPANMGTKQTFIEVNDEFSGDHICTATAIQMNYKVAGYLTIRENVLLNLPQLKDMKKDNVWVGSKMTASADTDATKTKIINGEHGQSAYTKSIEELEKSRAAPQGVRSSTEFIAALKKKSPAVPYVQGSVYYVPRSLREGVEFYMSLFARHSVCGEVAIPAVLNGIQDSTGIDTDSMTKYGGLFTTVDTNELTKLCAVVS